MSIVAVADTHAALWYLYDDPRLSIVAGDFIDTAVADRQSIAVSSISLVEVAYLAEKDRVPLTAYDDLVQALSDQEQVFVEAPVSMSISDRCGMSLVNKCPICRTESLRQRVFITTCRYSAGIGVYAQRTCKRFGNTTAERQYR